MAELCDLNVHFTMLRNKLKNNLSIHKYSVVVNNYSKRVLVKLKQMGVITDLKLTKTKASFNPDNCRNIKFYHRPTEVVNSRNYRKVIKQKLKDNRYNTLLISSCNGLKTLYEAVTEKSGGYIIGVVTGKTKLYDR